MKRLLYALFLIAAATFTVAPMALALTPVEEPATPAVTVRGEHDAITISAPAGTPVEIYSITGVKVKSGKVGQDGTLRVELSRGCYIVRCTSTSKKVMVG